MKSWIVRLGALGLVLSACETTSADEPADGNSYYVLSLTSDRLAFDERGLIAEIQEPTSKQHVATVFGHVVLNGEGEGYLDGKAGVIAVRTSEKRDIVGRLVLPRRDGSGMDQFPFTVPATEAMAESQAFHQAKRSYYQRLCQRPIPGSAWFRRQLRDTELALRIRPAVNALQSGTPTRPANNYLAAGFAILSGSRAVSENLSLEQGLSEAGAGARTVGVTSLQGVRVPEFDWKTLTRGMDPALDPLAGMIPADQHVVFFPTATDALTLAEEAGRQETVILRLAEPRSEDTRIQSRYEHQFGLSLHDLAHFLKPPVARSVAVTGSDVYASMGTDVAVLIESFQPTLLANVLLGQITLTARAGGEAEPVCGRIDGLSYRGIRSGDRRVCSLVAELDRAVVITNSLHQLRRLAGVRKDRTKSLASLPEYTFFRDRYQLGDEEETALIVISDATIRRWCGPRWRIGAARRIHDAAVMARIQATHLDNLVNDRVSPGPIEREAPLMAGGNLVLGPAGVYSSVFGSLDFMTPIAELPLDKVTTAEAAAYNQWRITYERQWTVAFDPIALRLGTAKEKLVADITVMPLIVRTEYQPLLTISQGAELPADAGEPHDALLHAALAINKKSQWVQLVGLYASMMTEGKVDLDPLSWLGGSISFYADDGPAWDRLAAMPEDRRARLSRSWFGGLPYLLQLPIAMHIEVTSGLELTKFLLALRAFVEQTAPGMWHWDLRTYRDRSYARVSLTEVARSEIKQADEETKKALEEAAIYYTASANALVVSLSEDVLHNAIDRQIARRMSQGDDGSAKSRQKPWLGKNVALQANQRLLDVLAGLAQDRYQAMMQSKAWDNLPILNEWKQRYPNRDPVELHERFWQTRLVCPGEGTYVWNDAWQTMESTVYGHPNAPRLGPAVAPALLQFLSGNFGLTFNDRSLRVSVSLDRKMPAPELSPVVDESTKQEEGQTTEPPTELAQAIDRLRAAPFDPEANLAVGEQLCLTGGEWEWGLPMLAIGSNPQLQEMARREIRRPDSPEGQLDLATAWSDLAESSQGRRRDSLMLRAGSWYRQVHPYLHSRSLKQGVQERLDRISRLGPIPEVPVWQEETAHIRHAKPLLADHAISKARKERSAILLIPTAIRDPSLGREHGASATLSIIVPPKAVVYVNGLATASTGSHRRYLARGLTPDRAYIYQVRVVTTRDGRAIEHSKTVELHAGQNVSLDFVFGTGQEVEPVPSAGDTVVVTTRGAQLKMGEEVVTRLSQGQRLKIVEIQGDWLGTFTHLHDRHTVGWIHSRDVALLRSPALDKPGKTRPESGSPE